MCGSTRREVLDRLHHNDVGLTAELLHGSVVQCRNRIALDWDNARLDTGGSDRYDREMIEVDRLIREGNVSAVRLSGRLSGDFTFTVKR